MAVEGKSEAKMSLGFMFLSPRAAVPCPAPATPSDRCSLQHPTKPLACQKPLTRAGAARELHCHCLRTHCELDASMPGARLYGPKSHLGEQPHVPEPYCGLQASISESLSAPPVAMLVLVLSATLFLSGTSIATRLEQVSPDPSVGSAVSSA